MQSHPTALKEAIRAELQLLLTLDLSPGCQHDLLSGEFRAVAPGAVYRMRDEWEGHTPVSNNSFTSGDLTCAF